MTYSNILGPVKNGIGLKNDISITAFRIQAALERNPSFVTIQGDIKNGYNKIDRESIATAMGAMGDLNHILSFSHTLMEPETYAP